MTVELETSRVSYTGAGTTGPFTIPFYFLANSDIRAIKQTIATGAETELALTTDFTLTGAGDEDGGELTLVSSLSSSFKLVIFRDPALLQETDYTPNDRFPSETHEQVADRAMMISQRDRDLIERALRLPDGDTSGATMILPSEVDRASKVLGFDADGEVRVFDSSSEVTTAGSVTFSHSESYDEGTVGDRLKNILYATDEPYGAAGDGTTDDDAAFAAIEALDDVFVYLPKGNYVTDGELTKRYYGPGKINGKQLYNWDRIQPLPQAARLWHKVRQNAADISILILGDSTGDATTEWVYKWATHLGTDAPTHSIKYRLYAAGAWGSESTIVAGSGSQSILVDNASVSGANSTSLFSGDQRDLIYSLSRTYDMVIFNLGHNEGTSNPQEGIFSRLNQAVIEAKTMNPTAELCCILQNPITDQTAHSARAVGAWREIAELHGLGAIDVYDVFTALGSPAGLYTDTTHPNASGMDVWAAVVRQAMSESMTHQGHRIPQNSLFTKAANYAPNPYFKHFNGSAPAGWTLSNCTAAKETGIKETFAHSVALTRTGASAVMQVNITTAHLDYLKGKWVTFIARVYRPAATTSTTAGRLGINLSVGTDGLSLTHTATDGWTWQVLHTFIPLNETAVTLQILGSATGSEVVYIDRVACVIGRVPVDADHTFDDQLAFDFTPTYTTTGTDFDAVTYDAITSGRCVIDGNKVTVTGVIRTDSITVGSATGSAVIGGLPVAAASGNKFYAAAAIANATGFGGDFPVNGRVTTNGTTIELYYRDASDTTDNALAVADMGTGADANSLTFSATYFWQ